MRAPELIAKFNEVIRLTQDAWRYEGLVEADEDFDSDKLKKSEDKHDEANAAAAEFCKLLSANDAG